MYKFSNLQIITSEQKIKYTLTTEIISNFYLEQSCQEQKSTQGKLTQNFYQTATFYY